MKHYAYIFILSVSSLVLPSCMEHKNTHVIYTSFYPIYDFTKRIVGDRMEVENITPYGMEPHDFEPTARQVSGMIDGKCLLLNGIGMDSWADSMPDELKYKSYKVTNTIEIQYIDSIQDPHVWLSISNAIKEMSEILSIVKTIDPENKSYYQENYETEVSKFHKLKDTYLTKFETLSNRYVVVSHAAFGYLCDEFSLSQIYINGLSSDDEPTAKSLESVISIMKQKNITTVFYEENESDEIANKIAKETGAKVNSLHTLEGLTIEEEKTEDYLSLLEDNLNKIWEANQ